MQAALTREQRRGRRDLPPPDAALIALLGSAGGEPGAACIANEQYRARALGRRPRRDLAVDRDGGVETADDPYLSGRVDTTHNVSRHVGKTAVGIRRARDVRNGM